MRNQPLSLEVIRVAEPCPKSWDGMQGDDRVRYCEGCRKHVHNLSAMTRGQAVTLLETCAAAGGLCVRFERGSDGRVETLEYRAAPLSVGRGWRFWAAFATCLAAGVAAVNAVVFRDSLPLPPPFGRPTSTMVLGRVAMPVPAPVPPSPPAPANP